MNPTYPPSLDQPDSGESAKVATALAEWLPVKVRGMKPEALARIEPHVRTVVAAAAPTTVTTVHGMLRAAFDYVDWALDELGILQVETVWHPDNLHHFVAEENGHRSDDWQYELDRRLNQIGRAVNPRFWPREPKKRERRHPSAPYSAVEEDALRAAAAHLGEPGRPSEAAVTGLSCGAGLSAPDIALALPTDVIDLGKGRLGIQVVRHHPRLVPIRADFTELVVRAVEFAGDGPFVLARCRNAVYSTAERVHVHGFGYLKLKRARSTWLQAHLVAGTPLAALRVIAGPLSMNTLADLLGPASEAFSAEAAAIEGLRA